MFEKVLTCPICKSNEFTNAIICQDTLVSQESFVLTDCKTCGLRITNPRPIQAAISKYYQSPDYNPHTQSAKTFIGFLYRVARKLNLRLKYKIIIKHQSSGSILDFGSGTGEFLSYMKSKGWVVMGIESNTDSLAYAKEKYSLNVYEDLTHIPDNQTFNVISLWHVLEHIRDINSVITELSTRLTKNGTLLIAVPNYNSFDAQHYKEHWAGYDVPRHLFHFNQVTMKKLLKVNHLSLVKVIPMKLDSYYVSILSERNKKNTATGFFKGLLTGYRSNQNASKNKNEYSSLLYVIKK